MPVNDTMRCLVVPKPSVELLIYGVKKGRHVRKIVSLLAAAAVCAVLCGCNGLAAVDSKTYLDSIPVADLATLLANKAAGTYPGEYTIAAPPGGMAVCRSMNVVVTVDASHSVTAIELTSPESMNYPDFAGKLSQLVVAQQSLAVDVVSGASYSTKAYLKAVENALAN